MSKTKYARLLTPEQLDPTKWRVEMWRLVRVDGYRPIPRLSVACAKARPRNGWVDADATFRLVRPDRRPLALEVYLPEWDL